MKAKVTIMLFLILTLTGCLNLHNKKEPQVDDIAIYYGVSSYAKFGAEQAVINDLYDRLSSLKFEKTSEKIELLTSLMINFSYQGKSVRKFTVDRNGVFQLDGKRQCFKAAPGSFDFDYVYKVYREGNQ